MKKRFVVIINSTDPEQAKAFTDYVRSHAAWWHWLAGTWLLVDSTGVMTSEELRDKALEIFPGVHNMVLEFRADGTDTWFGFGPKREDRNMFSWMRNIWRQ